MPRATHPALPGTPLQRGSKPTPATIPSGEGWQEASNDEVSASARRVNILSRNGHVHRRNPGV
jgi:hypothetical protein